MKNLTKIKVPKKYEDAIELIEMEEKGCYVMVLNEGWNNGNEGRMYYAETQKELLEMIRSEIFKDEEEMVTLIEVVEEPSMTPQEHLLEMISPMELINQVTYSRIVGFTLLQTCKELVEGGLLHVYHDPMEKALKAMGEMPKDEDAVFEMYIEVMSLAIKNFYDKDLNIVVSAPLENFYNTYGIVQFNRFIGFENNIMEVEHSSKEEPFEISIDRYISACEGMTLEEMEDFCKRHNDLEASKQYIKGGTK